MKELDEELSKDLNEEEYEPNLDDLEKRLNDKDPAASMMAEEIN